MRISLQSLVIALSALAPVTASASLNRAGDASVEFVALGPAGMKIRGTTHDLAVVDKGQDVIVKVPLAGLKTGISLRDNHMREKYLQVDQFRSAELLVSRAALKLPASDGPSAGDTQGTLSLHGKTKAAKFHYEAKRTGNVFHVRGTLHLNMNEFGIEVPSYAGITVKPDVDVNVEFDAKDG